MHAINTLAEVLAFAIGEEEAAMALYARLATEADNPAIREALLEFAEEERKHKAKLQAVQAGSERVALGGTPPVLSITDYLVDIPPRPNMTYQDLLIIAMKKEKAAFKMYTDLARQVVDDDIKALLLRLAEEEAKHKLRFEIEYEEHYLQDN